MNRIYFSFAIFIILTFSNTTINAQNTNVAYLKGTASHFSTEEIMLVINKYDTQRARIGNDGKIELQILCAQPILVGLNIKNYYTEVYFEPGDTLSFRLDTLMGFSFDGSKKLENEYLFKKNSFKQKHLFGRKNESLIYGERYTQFIEILNSKYAPLKDDLKDLTIKEPVSPEFISFEQQNLLFEYRVAVTDYPIKHPRYSKPPKDFKSDSTLLKIKQFEDQIQQDFNNPLILTSLLFRMKIQSKHESLVGAKQIINNSEDLKDNIASIKTHFSNTKIKDFLFFQVFHKMMWNGQVPPSNIIQQFKEVSQDDFYSTKLSDLFKRWRNLDKGKPGVGFEYPDQNNDTVSLKDLEGQPIFVNIWATWCRPCKKEHAPLNELVDQFGTEIKFVNISIDQNASKWKQKIKEMHPKIIQLIATEGRSAQILKDYIIKGIPRYMLFDKSNNIISINTQRPSSPELRKLLETTLD